MAAAVPLCDEHNEVQYHWCKTCKQFFCHQCRYTHRGHDKKVRRFTIDELRDNYDKERKVEAELTELKDQAEALGDHHKDKKEGICQIHQSFKSSLSLQYSPQTDKIRIASWNTQNARKYVRLDCMNRTIVKHNFNIMAIQEIGENGNTIRSVCELLQRKDTSWNYIFNSSLGFLWKGNPDITMIYHESLSRSLRAFEHTPLLAVFSIRDFRIAIINFHLRPRSPKIKKLNDQEVLLLGKALSQAKTICEREGHGVPEHNFLLIGDFNTIPLDPDLDRHEYRSLFGITEYTNVADTDTYDNIIVHSTFKQRCIQHDKKNIETAGCRSATSRRLETLREEKVSDHYPIYADFYY